MQWDLMNAQSLQDGQEFTLPVWGLNCGIQVENWMPFRSLDGNPPPFGHAALGLKLVLGLQRWFKNLKVSEFN